METRNESNDSQLPVEERRLRLDEKRLLLDNSFARKWLPTLVTLMVGLIAGMFSYVQQQNAGELATELGKELNLPAGPDNAILVTSSRELPGGILEVWLPPQRS